MQPLLIFAIFIGCGRFIGRDGFSILNLFGICLTWFFFLHCYFFFFTEILEVSVPNWLLHFNGLTINFSFDFLTFQMNLVVLFVASGVILYSIEYMNDDAHVVRFLAYLWLFLFFMLFLVCSGNLLQLFIGWEGVGITSFLLINFWFTRVEAVRSSFKAIIFNRVGDIGFVFGMIVIFSILKILDVFFLNSESLNLWLFLFNVRSSFILDFSFFLIILGALAKSAQLFLHAWLPDAMEGPTPVSALLHSATMVTIGLYVFLRMSFLFSICSSLFFFLSILGCFTAFISALIAFCANDIKKVIAYSTCSQLGFMFASLGFSNFSGVFFHLLVHAFFKAMLFLTSGLILHSLFDEQDLRRMGGLGNYMPIAFLFFTIGVIASVGFPFISGFYSKEFLLFFFLSSGSMVYFYAFTILFLTSTFTILYSVRVLVLSFLGVYRSFRCFLKFLTDYNSLGYMLTIIFVFGFCSIFIGFLFQDYLIGIATPAWFYIFPAKNINLLDSVLRFELISVYLKNSLFFLSVLLFLLYVFCKEREIVLKSLFLSVSHAKYSSCLLLYEVLSQRFWFVFFYKLIGDFFKYLSYNLLFKYIDKGVIEKIFTSGLYKYFYSLCFTLEKLKPINFFYILGSFVFYFFFYFLFFFLILEGIYLFLFIYIYLICYNQCVLK